MNFEQESCCGSNSALIIPKRRLVRCPNFPQFPAGAFENVADAKSSADLNHFTARDNDLGFLSGEMMHDQNQSCRTIVNHGCSLASTNHGHGVLEVCGAHTTGPAS